LEASIVGILFSTVTFISISLFKNRGLSDVW
jgi:hypothetical protein